MDTYTSDTVAALKGAIERESASQEALAKIGCSVEKQRIIFLGKELKDNEILDNLGLEADKVVQIFLRPEIHIRDPLPVTVTDEQ